MKAVIMAGGKGERLKPLTDNMPKPMVPMINKPVMEYIVQLLKRHGISKMAFSLGYKPDVIMEYFGDGRALGADISYFLEDKPLGTAGGVKNCSPFILNEDTEDKGGDDCFVVMSGDAFTEVDLSEMIDFHRYSGGLITMCVKQVENVKGLGVVSARVNGLIEQFLEKPETTSERLANTGIYVVDKSVLKLIPNGYYDFSKDLFPRLLGRLYAYETREYWSDVGTLSSYYKTNLYIAENMYKFGLINIQ